jgi:ABC-type antimicrobial peptide transport system permease subunit
MFKNYLLVTLRNIKKDKGYFFISVTGLAVGIACCVLMLLWSRYELSFDRFHENADDIYRVISEVHTANQVIHNARTPNPIGPALKDQYPEIINFTRTQGVENWLVRYGEKRFMDDTIAMADPSFFEMFTFPFSKGDPKTAFNDRFSLVITEKMARKYFENDEPMDKVIKIFNNDFKVTGVIKNVPENSHIMFDCIFPIINMEEFWETDFNSWKGFSRFYTYIQLQKNSSWKEVSQKISQIVKNHDPGSQTRVYLQPLTDIHLRSNFEWDLDNYKQGNITNLYIFSLTAICILLIACFGFMNLSTARYGTRTKEVGMRKIVGANRRNIIDQFFAESIIFSFIALFFAILLVALFLPVFNDLSGQQLKLTMFFPGDAPFILGLIVITLFTGIVSGSYPALFLSSFQPIIILKGRGMVAGASRGAYLRKTLVVIQFVLVIILILGTTVFFKQLQYINNKDLGFEKKNVIFFMSHTPRKYLQYMKNEILGNPGVLSITAAPPPIFPEEGIENAHWEGKHPDQNISIHPVPVDYDYLKTFKMKMAEGRFFSQEYSADISNYILNETAVKVMGISSPRGKRFWLNGREGSIIGVVKDYHHGTLHTPIEPVVLTPSYGEEIRMISVKINPSDLPGTLEFLEEKYKRFNPGFPFTYNFLDETINNFYKTEQRISTVAGYFTFVTICIACLGLLGLASYMVVRRTMEVAVRKVFGASMPAIAWLLLKEFIKCVVAALIIAYPVAWYIMNRWLQNFTYRIDVDWWVFLLAGVLAMLIALFTVGFHTIKAARTNPIDNLRYE